MEAEWPDKDEDLLDNVYKLQWLSRMNAIYYELRLAKVQVISTWMEGIIAATASGSGLAAVVGKSQGYIGIAGQYVWPIVAVLAAIAAIVKPIYAPGRKIEAYTRQHQGYQLNYFTAKKLAFTVRQEGKVTDGHRRRFEALFDRHIQLSTDAKSGEDEASPKDKYRNEAEQRVKAEMPPESFWWPAEKKNTSHHTMNIDVNAAAANRRRVSEVFQMLKATTAKQPTVKPAR